MGGNVFKGNIRSESIKREDIKPTLKHLFAELQRIFPGISPHLEKIATLGSVGKKDVSGDIDIAIDEGSLKSIEDWGLDRKIVDEYFKKFKARAKSASDKQIMKKAVLVAIAEKIQAESSLISVDTKQAGSGTIFTQVPQFDVEGKNGKYVQCDLMFGNLDWLQFSYYSNNYQDSTCKGLHRTQLMLTLFTEKGYTFRHGEGIKDKETGEWVARTPEQAIDLLNRAWNFNIDRETLSDFFKLQEFIEQNLSKEEQDKLWARYFKILDSTRCDIPTTLQNQWLDRQDELDLTGKFLPPSSKLYPFRTEDN